MKQTDNPIVQSDDEMLPEYDFSQLGQPVRGKHAQAMRQGYSVIVHHPDGTTTHREIPPQDANSNTSIYHGDYVNGDKIMGDKVMGDKIGTQINNANTAELLQILANLRQTATQFPNDIQEGVMVDLEEVETEITKPEAQRNLPKLRMRLIALATIVSVAGGAIANIADFTNNITDLATKAGIELKLPSGF
ncbi:MAG: hypothetical protein VKJ02_14685 [Snowella sp.]|nr:hypothetical protein [Snowella sp.]